MEHNPQRLIHYAPDLDSLLETSQARVPIKCYEITMLLDRSIKSNESVQSELRAYRDYISHISLHASGLILSNYQICKVNEAILENPSKMRKSHVGGFTVPKMVIRSNDEYDYVAIVKSPIHGYGLMLLEPLPYNRSYFLEYTGQAIGNALVPIRTQRYLALDMQSLYIFSIDSYSIVDDLVEEYISRSGDISEHDKVDATYSGNQGRLANHSCGPNMAPVTASGGRILMGKADKNYHCSRGCELTFDYHLSGPGSLICNCGSKNCRSLV